MVELVDVNKNDPDSIKYIIKFLRVNTIVVTKKFLNSRNVPDIGSIPIFVSGIYKRIKEFHTRKNDNIMFPEVPLPLQHGFIYWHDNMSHLHPKSMFRLAILGFLP